MWVPNLATMATDAPNTAAAILSLGIDVVGAGRKPLPRVKLLPYGTLSKKVGSGTWVLAGKGQALDVVTATRAFQRERDMSLDFDNQTILGVDRGVAIAGQIKTASLRAEDDGIYADVVWTMAGLQKIEGLQYRYLSAQVMAEKGTGRITRIIGAGLSNMPDAFTVPATASAGGNMYGLTDEERAMASRFGLSDAEYLASKEELYGTKPASLLTKEEQAMASSFGQSEAEYLASKQELYGGQSPSALTTEERAICSALGVSEAEFLSARNRGWSNAR